MVVKADFTMRQCGISRIPDVQRAVEKRFDGNLPSIKWAGQNPPLQGRRYLPPVEADPLFVKMSFNVALMADHHASHHETYIAVS
jgi:hypothetical protein